jgi:hypothetical protein
MLFVFVFVIGVCYWCLCLLLVFVFVIGNVFSRLARKHCTCIGAADM